MSYNIKMVKIVSGETVMGIYNENEKVLQDVVIIQAVPSHSGAVQIAILPFGFPYEEDITGKIKEEHILYNYNKIPEELKNKYLEAKSNIKIASSMNGLGSGGGDIIL